MEATWKPREKYTTEENIERDHKFENNDRTAHMGIMDYRSSLRDPHLSGTLVDTLRRVEGTVPERRQLTRVGRNAHEAVAMVTVDALATKQCRSSGGARSMVVADRWQLGASVDGWSTQGGDIVTRHAHDIKHCACQRLYTLHQWRIQEGVTPSARPLSPVSLNPILF